MKSFILDQTSLSAYWPGMGYSDRQVLTFSFSFVQAGPRSAIGRAPDS